MACGATLKRHREFDPLHQSSPDRSSPKRLCLPSTPVASTAAAAAAADRLLPSSGSPSAAATTMAHSRLQQLGGPAFVEAAQKLIHDKLTARMSSSPREKQLIDGGKSEMGLKGDSMTLGVYPSLVSSQLPVAGQSWHSNISRAVTSTHASVKKEQLFTMKQVEMICRNVLKEQEENIRGEFDNILSNKVAEQYEGLLRFNQAQIHNRFDNSDASYVS